LVFDPRPPKTPTPIRRKSSAVSFSTFEHRIRPVIQSLEGKRPIQTFATA